jgi:mRNA-degrading endonuclease RelE of RelBE toxin-antitoxin system
MAYQVEFAESVKAHLQVLTVGQQATVLDAIQRQLTNEPLVETRNRKPLRPNPVAPWELRVGSMRVFYDVSKGPPQVVRVLAVGVKDRNVLRIGGQEIQL